MACFISITWILEIIMLFNSWQFILIFLPIVFFVYFGLNHFRFIAGGKIWLIFTSLFFYAYWDTQYLVLIILSILFNFFIGTNLSRNFQTLNCYKIFCLNRKIILSAAIITNLVLLGYYKYMNFFITNVNEIFGTVYIYKPIILPLAISFFTFTQIAYLMDSYHRETDKYNLINYTLFVTFFPHLIAGPIVSHRDIMPQFESLRTLNINYGNVLKGLFIFSIGLFKKVVIADTFAVWAGAGFDENSILDFFTAWATSLSYTLQLYFDFSGYCDMAIGISLLFNIWLPINFNSPYKSCNIQDFWRRWHITLSQFLRIYLYIPLGGNRFSEIRTCINLMITFILGGLWHGATWMFIIWGMLHGIALVIHRLWKKLGISMPHMVAWSLTFTFVNVSWVFFRAKTIDDAYKVIKGMFDFYSILEKKIEVIPTKGLAWGGCFSDMLLTVFPPSFVPNSYIYLAIIAFLIIIFQKNSLELTNGNWHDHVVFFKLIPVAFLFCMAVYFVLAEVSSVFLYFNF